MSGKDIRRYDMPALESAETGAGGAFFPCQPGECPLEKNPEDEGYRKGFATGERSGKESAERNASNLIAGIENLARDLAEFRSTLAKDAEPRLLELAVAIARRILLAELSLHPERIAGMVKEAIRRIERTGTVTIRVHPDLYEMFLSLRRSLEDVYPHIHFDVDPSVSPSGPVVVGSTQEVLTDIDEQLRNVLEDIRGGHGGG